MQRPPHAQRTGDERFPEDLIAYWEHLHWLYLGDQQRLLLRFADTRVIPVLSDIFTTDQWAAIAGPVAHWFYVDRNGEVSAPMQVAGKHQPCGALDISQKQIDALLESSAPDTAIDFLSDYLPELIPKYLAPSRFHAHIAAVFQLAKRNRIDSWPDQMGWSTRNA